jgi:tryptophan synthase alpha chain
VELGIPFSDPLADGATIQQASFTALERGITPKLCLELAAELRSQMTIPLLFMTYYNPVLSFGVDAFCQASARSGVDGLIIPDLPPEEGQELETATRNYGLDLVYLLAPTSRPERIQQVAQRSRGFIYLVSLTGVTGPRDRLPPGLEAFVSRVRAQSSLPLCVGFGIAGPEQAKRVAQVADGVIVGSRLIQLMETGDPSEQQGFIQQLRQALDFQGNQL